MVVQRRREQVRCLVEDESQIGDARRQAQRLAMAYGLSEAEAGRVAIVVSELATNTFLHGGGGELLLQPLNAGATEAIEVIAIDRGRGMYDIERCLRDGYSTGGTPGTGLGAVRRLSTEFDLYSVTGEGTVVMARVGARAAARLGVISIQLHGETECGDSWAFAQSDEIRAVMVVDGLGHGSFAALAAEGAQRVFADLSLAAPRTVLEQAHRALGSTRGAAAAIAHLGDGQQLSYAGVGNIAGYLVGAEKSQGLVSHNGTLGAHMNRLQQFEYERAADSLLIMHTDGISARWDLRKNALLRARHPAIIAAIIYRDHARTHDDATVVVLN